MKKTTKQRMKEDKEFVVSLFEQSRIVEFFIQSVEKGKFDGKDGLLDKKGLLKHEVFRVAQHINLFFMNELNSRNFVTSRIEIIKSALLDVYNDKIIKLANIEVEKDRKEELYKSNKTLKESLNELQ